MGFRRQFIRKMWLIELSFLYFNVCRIFFSSLSLSNTSSFFTLSVRLIFSVLLKHRILKLSRFLSSTFRSVQVSAPHKAMVQV
jgi:hypothetical protein